MKKNPLMKIGLLGILLCFTNLVFAQRVITGVVSDENEPIPGASITVKESPNTGTVSDLSGNFKLTLPANAKNLSVSFVGYETQIVPVKGKSIFQIVLKSSDTQLDEIVVVGYGSMKKSDLTGAVGSLKRDDFLKNNVTSINAGLQGKMAGVQVVSNDGAPGSGVSIQIRGANSFSTSSEPLYVVDGIPYNTASTATGQSNLQTSNPLSTINPNDIESIEVLKDASSTAIYGSRGANGVVLITTRKGAMGKDKVEFSANFGFSTVKQLDVLDPYTYALYINEETLNSYGEDGTLPYGGRWTYSYMPDGSLIKESGTYSAAPEDYLTPGKFVEDEYGNRVQIGGANWQDKIFTNSFSQEYNLTVSGASDKGGYSISGNVLDQNGVIRNSGYKRYTIRTNIFRKVHKWLEVGLNSNLTKSKTDFAKTSSGTGVIRSALLYPTTLQENVSNREDLLWLAANPKTYLDEAKDQLDDLNTFTSAYAEVGLAKFLKFRQNVGYSYSISKRNYYYTRNTGEGQAPTNGLGGQSDNWYSSFTSESLLTFNHTFNKKHTLGAVAGITYEQSNYGWKAMSAKGFPTDLTGEYDMSAALNPQNPQSGRGQNALLSFLGRVNYSYDNRYLLTVSYRRDGSSKFAKGNKYADFASGAIAWRFTEEDFMKSVRWLSNGKLRFSYGETGNQGIGAYSTIEKLGISNYPLGGGMNSGLAESAYVNPNLKWETTSQYDLGLDLGFLNDRINFTIDLYYKKTRDLLQSLKMPQSSGWETRMANFGNVTNKGLELSGNFHILKNKPIDWTLSANISFNKNEISGLKSDQFASDLWYGAGEVFIQRNGCPIGAIYGYVEDGYWDNEAEIRSDPRYANASKGTINSMIGEIKYWDKNGDGAITPEDRDIIGDTNPDFIYGITNNFAWKNLSLSFFFQASHGNDVFNGNLTDVTMSNIGNIPRFAYESRWTPENYQSAKWPKAIAGYTRAWQITNRYVEDGSYLRLKNLTVGYKFLKPIKGIDLINLTFTATNLFTITDYSWYDPDVNVFGGDSARRGVDLYSYPLSRTFSLGINMTF